MSQGLSWPVVLEVVLNVKKYKIYKFTIPELWWFVVWEWASLPLYWVNSVSTRPFLCLGAVSVFRLTLHGIGIKMWTNLFRLFRKRLGKALHQNFVLVKFNRFSNLFSSSPFLFSNKSQQAHSINVSLRHWYTCRSNASCRSKLEARYRGIWHKSCGVFWWRYQAQILWSYLPSCEAILMEVSGPNLVEPSA